MFKKFSARMAVWPLILICLASAALMFWASRTDSAIMDELAHIPAGYGYVHNLDYRLNPEHPPLIKALAALPVLFLNPYYPTQSDAWQNQINAQWAMGAAFLYGSGNDATAIVDAARIFPIIITILVVLLIYFFARRLMGPWWALLPAFLFAFSPTVLAHGHYVTTDVGAAFGILLGIFYFSKYIEAPTTKHLIYAGLAFGVAQLMKFSTPFLVPLFIFLVLVLWFRGMARHWQITENRWKTFFFDLCKRAWKLALIFAIGYVVVVYPVYFLFTYNYPIAKQVSDTATILTSFATGPTPVGQFCKGTRCLADLNIWMAGNAFFRPVAQYMLGVLMVLQRADGGNTIYFLGQVRNAGGWIYFPVLYLAKESIPALIIVILALLFAVWWTIKKVITARFRIGETFIDYLGTHFAEFSMISFIVFYWVYSMHSPLNIGIRHLMPTIPLIYILAAGVWKRWVTAVNFPQGMPVIDTVAILARSFIYSIVKYAFLVLLLCWLLMETLLTAPYFLSYFNEFAGSTPNGYHLVTDSNYDWGQDLLRLQAWVNAHPQVDTIGVDYFGGGSPSYYLGAKEVDWSSSKGNPADQGIHWLAVSVNTLEGATQPLAPGKTRNASDTYSWLTALRPPAKGMGNVPTPDFRAGTSIFIYHL